MIIGYSQNQCSININTNVKKMYYGVRLISNRNRSNGAFERFYFLLTTNRTTFRPSIR